MYGWRLGLVVAASVLLSGWASFPLLLLHTAGRAVVVAVYLVGAVLFPLCVLSVGLLVLVAGGASAVLRGWLAVSRVGAAVAGASVVLVAVLLRFGAGVRAVGDPAGCLAGSGDVDLVPADIMPCGLLWASFGCSCGAAGRCVAGGAGGVRVRLVAASVRPYCLSCAFGRVVVVLLLVLVFLLSYG